MLDAISSWLTPTTLFLLLNFIIATIYLTSHKAPPPSSSTHQPNPPDSEHAPHRTTSILQKFKSINFTNFYTSPNQTLHETESDVLTQSKEEEEYEAEDQFNEAADDNKKTETHDGDVFSGERSIDEVYSQLKIGTGRHNRSKSDMEPETFKLAKKMTKSASTKSVFNHFEEAEILEASHPEKAKESSVAVEDVEVDLKADDFINKFKQQLELQRRNSILRYNKLLGRGAHK